MKVALLVLLSSFTGFITAKNVFPNANKFKPLDLGKRDILIEQPLFQEPPKMNSEHNNIFVPNGEEPQKGPTLLTSSISTAKDISVFAYYVRDNVDVSSRFNDRKRQSIVFAPTDQGIETLSLKPWQFPTPVDDTLSEEETDKVISSNINDFIQSHIIDGELPFAALKDSRKGVQFISENGNNIKLVNDDGDYYVSAVVDGFDQEWLKVESVINADNGAILVISKPLSVPRV